MAHKKYFGRRMSFSFAITGPEHEADCLEGFCEGLVRANQIMIRADPDRYPCCLGCSGYHYVPPESCTAFDWTANQPVVDLACQHVLGAYDLERRKRGTCIDLACLLCAVLREKENDRRARVGIDFLREKDGVNIQLGKYHAVVVRGDKTVIDPVTQLTANQEVQACGCGE